MIDLGIKSQLAKLLATEDLIVENSPSVSTASFDVVDRILRLPIWNKASNTVYDLLVGHEVGHALFTPLDECPFDLNPQFLNVVEDVRIEKLMKRKYPGMNKTFYQGYKELVDDNFFGVEDQDLSQTNLADRVNLYFKGGCFLDISFNDEEQEIVDLIAKVETFQDTIEAARVLFNYCKAEVQPKPIEEPKPDSEQQGDTTSSGEKPTEEEEEHEQPQMEEKEPEVQTAENLEENLQELIDKRQTRSSVYAEVPEINLEDYVITNSQVHREINEYFEEQLKPLNYTDPYGNQQSSSADFSGVDNDYKQFKSSSQKEVNYLVKEFECRKSADAYARSFSSRSGVLDCSKLHTYKYEEDLFKKINVIPDGKNHGLVFILDWSGSMAHCMMDTIRQLYNLIWFCKKVQIPFDVYAFTQSYKHGNNNLYVWSPPNGNGKENDLVIDDDFSLLHFFSHKVKKAELDKQLRNIWRLAYSFDHNVPYIPPNRFYLSGTPLNETVICLHQLIPQFKKQNHLQKVHCVILTDGEAPPLPVYSLYKSYTGEDKMGTRHLGFNNSFLRNRKTGYVYPFPPSYHEFTKVLLDDLRQSIPGVNLIGIRLLSSRDLRNFINRYQNESVSDEQMKKARKDKSCMISGAGYHQYFGLLTNSLFNDTEFEVQEDASKTQIKSAFMKSLKSKSLNKKVLNQFVELIA